MKTNICASIISTKITTYFISGLLEAGKNGCDDSTKELFYFCCLFLGGFVAYILSWRKLQNMKNLKKKQKEIKEL